MRGEGWRLAAGEMVTDAEGETRQRGRGRDAAAGLDLDLDLGWLLRASWPVGPSAAISVPLEQHRLPGLKRCGLGHL